MGGGSGVYPANQQSSNQQHQPTSPVDSFHRFAKDTFRLAFDHLSSKPNYFKDRNRYLSSMSTIISSSNKAQIVKDELKDLKCLLNHEKSNNRKEGVKKVIAAMMMGRDVGGPLFMDMLKNMHTNDLEVKKMVYLYLLSYSSTEPDFVLLSINTFLKDCKSPNSLIRALAIRTMCALPVPKILEYLIEPLIATLQSDLDSLVKRTSALGIAKLYQTAPHLVVGDNESLLLELENILEDPSSHSSILSNALLTLGEIKRGSTGYEDKFNTKILKNIITKLDEFSEWSLLMVLDQLSLLLPKIILLFDEENGDEDLSSSFLTSKLTPLLQHSNIAIIIGSIRLLLSFRVENTIKRRVILTLIHALGPSQQSSSQLWILLRFCSSILGNLFDWINFDESSTSSSLCMDESSKTTTIELLLTSLYVKTTDSFIIKEEKIGLIVRIIDEYNLSLPEELRSSLLNLIWSWVVEESKCLEGDNIFVYETVSVLAPLVRDLLPLPQSIINDINNSHSELLISGIITLFSVVIDYHLYDSSCNDSIIDAILDRLIASFEEKDENEEKGKIGLLSIDRMNSSYLTSLILFLTRKSGISETSCRFIRHITKEKIFLSLCPTHQRDLIFLIKEKTNEDFSLLTLLSGMEKRMDPLVRQYYRRQQTGKSHYLMEYSPLPQKETMISTIEDISYIGRSKTLFPSPLISRIGDHLPNKFVMSESKVTMLNHAAVRSVEDLLAFE